jgi:hypothetical protein
MVHPTAVVVDPSLDKIATQRQALKSRHSQALSRLMDERDDLRGVHALADFVDESMRWTA